MGKNKKKDPEKKASLQAKKEAKQNKAAHKRIQKEAKISGTSDGKIEALSNDEQQSFDALLEVYKHRDIAGSKPVVESLDGYPPARGNFTFTLCEGEQKGKQDIYLFGGEYYDGIQMVIVDQLLRWDKNYEWKQIINPSAAPAPAPRCAHSTVYYNGSLYVFGGELASAENYHHYKDLWRYDIKKLTWTELVCKTGSVPSPRSGHSAVVWKSFMILFGGFYEAARDTPRWFNDVYVFNLQTEQWMDVPHSKLGKRPEPRSACNMALIGDTVIIHGGYSKLINSAVAGGRESKVHTDTWMLNLKPLLQSKPPTWERLISSSVRGESGAVNSRNPNGRSGCASATYKNRMLVFGGVVDSEMMHHKMDSIFYNDLFAFDMDQRKWFPLKARRGKTTDIQYDNRQHLNAEVPVADTNIQNVPPGAVDNEDVDDGDDDLSDLGEEHGEEQSGWGVEKLRSNMFAFYDADGNLIYEKMEHDASAATNENKEVPNAEGTQESSEEEEEEKTEEKENDSEHKLALVTGKATRETPKQTISYRNVKSSSVMTLDPETNAPEAVQLEEPLPRMNAGLVVKGGTLYLYGGLVEIGDREVTLDDMWCFDLKKREAWKCLYPGTMHKHVWRGAIHDDDDSYISTGQGEDDEGDDDDDSDEDPHVEDTKSNNLDRAEEELVQLSAQYGLADGDRSPEVGENLADFYARTRDYWNGQAVEKLKQSKDQDDPTNKELKREGFLLAQKHFDELEPVLKRLQELGLTKRGSQSRKQDKKEKKKS